MLTKERCKLAFEDVEKYIENYISKMIKLMTWVTETES